MVVTVLLFIYAALCLAFAVGYGLFSVLLNMRSGEQPIRSKSPKLLFCSSMGSAASSFCVCIVIIGTSVISQGFGHIIYLGLVGSEIIAVPIILSPYILRYFSANNK